MASYFTEDANVLNPAGRTARGPDEIRRMFNEDPVSPGQGARFESSCGSVRFLSPDIAEIDCRFNVSNIRTEQGAPRTSHGMYTAILKRQGDTWKIASARAMVPSQPPGGAATTPMQQQPTR